MSAVLHTDPTQGLELVSAIGQGRERTRYLFTAANCLDPEHIEQREWMQMYNSYGGEEIETNCFRRTIHGFLPRAYLTPLEVWTKSYPVEFLSEGMEENTVRIVSVVTDKELELAKSQANTHPSFLHGKPNQNVKFYPGDEVIGILRNGAARGIVEIKALEGTDWYDGTAPGVAQQLNADFFPQRPIRLVELQEQIDRGSARSTLHRTVADDMMRSCRIAKRYMETKLAEKHVLFRERVSITKEYTYTYSGVERSWLEQLGMQPQDVENTDSMSRIAELLAASQATGGGSQVTPELIGSIAAVVAREFAAVQNELEKPKTPKGKDKPE